MKTAEINMVDYIVKWKWIRKGKRNALEITKKGLPDKWWEILRYVHTDVVGGRKSRTSTTTLAVDFFKKKKL